MNRRELQRATIEQLVQDYEQAAIAYEQSIKAANSRAANRATDRVSSAYRELRRREAETHLLPLLKSENDCVRSFVAADALEFAPEQGVPVLEELASRPGRRRTPAEYALREWRAGKSRSP
jgi:hypothetical protein